ncbi:hypothetical protein KY308_01140 [Candidatus Woesearchaeota archaeon]|nr:hypothetical protein [Candidatus Woesearchaeota archaeon]
MGEKSRIGRLETVFQNPEILPLIEDIRNSDMFKQGSYYELEKSSEINLLRGLIHSDRVAAERTLFYDVGKVLSENLFPEGHEHYYETRWNNGGELVSIIEKSPLRGGFIHDHQLLNPEEYPQLDIFRLPAPAKLLTTRNMLMQAGKKRKKKGKVPVNSVILRVKSPQSKAAKITNYLYEHYNEDILDTVGCKVILPDSNKHVLCYNLLERLKKGLGVWTDKKVPAQVRVMTPYDKNIEDTIKTPREGKEELKWIFTNCVYTAKGQRIVFMLHIEPESVLALENSPNSSISHFKYHMEKLRKMRDLWGDEENAMYTFLKGNAETHEY